MGEPNTTTAPNPSSTPSISERLEKVNEYLAALEPFEGGDPRGEAHDEFRMYGIYFALDGLVSHAVFINSRIAGISTHEASSHPYATFEAIASFGIIDPVSLPQYNASIALRKTVTEACTQIDTARVLGAIAPTVDLYRAYSRDIARWLVAHIDAQ